MKKRLLYWHFLFCFHYKEQNDTTLNQTSMAMGNSELSHIEEIMPPPQSPHTHKPTTPQFQATQTESLQPPPSQQSPKQQPHLSQSHKPQSSSVNASLPDILITGNGVYTPEEFIKCVVAEVTAGVTANLTELLKPLLNKKRE